MYTGITQGLYPVTKVEKDAGLLRYEVELDEALCKGLETGASVAIDGVCQSVAALKDLCVSFEAIGETLERTTLGALALGQKVSVERSAKIGDEIGGHELAGHVIGTGTISEISRDGANLQLKINVPAEWMKYIYEKGFIAVDGSSLTVGKTDPAGSFEVHLIPETLRRTNFGSKKPNDPVNIELDAKTVAIVDTVERFLGQRE